MVNIIWDRPFDVRGWGGGGGWVGCFLGFFNAVIFFSLTKKNSIFFLHMLSEPKYFFFSNTQNHFFFFFFFFFLKVWSLTDFAGSYDFVFCTLCELLHMIWHSLHQYP